MAMIAAAVALVAGCTGGGAPKTDNVADTVPGKAPDVAQRCNKSGDVPVVKTVVTTADGVHLAGARFGAGQRGVLLLPQKGADLCPWFDYASSLVNSGFNVLAIDFRGTGYSEDSHVQDYTADAEAGVKALKVAGAQRVVIVGASLGAATALVTAGREPDQIAGVVSLSYPDNAIDVTGGAGAEPHTPLQAAKHITSPLLVAFTSGDPQAAKPDSLVASVPGPQPQLVGRPGVSHGWDMLKVGDDDVRPDVMAFLQQYD
jgi:pimeloyl-ACP methyl ester carboxylesterase